MKQKQGITLFMDGKDIKMAKKKIIFDEEKARQKKALRIPMPKIGLNFKDKSKYTRKKKHKISNEN